MIAAELVLYNVIFERACEAIPPLRYGLRLPPNSKSGSAHVRSPGGSPEKKSMGSPKKQSMGLPVEKSMRSPVKKVSGPGRAQIGSGPCEGYVSYMCVHITLYYRRLSDIVLYDPMLCLGSDPILSSLGNPWGSPKATNIGLPKEKSMGLPREKSMGLPQTLKSDFLWGYTHPQKMGAGWGDARRSGCHPAFLTTLDEMDTGRKERLMAEIIDPELQQTAESKAGQRLAKWSFRLGPSEV
jgi:hypothetical protein